MYKLFKEKGSNLNITLTNTSTKEILNLGLLSMEILDILAKEGYTFDDKSEIRMTDAWDLNISEDGAARLSRLALKIHRPDRAKVNKTENPKDLFQKPNKEIDAMDVMLGLANYN